MKAYLDLLRHVREHGRLRGDRTGTGTRSVFGYQLRVDLSEGFPLLTTKKVHTKSVVNELLWFMKGETHVEWLQERGVTIWDEWATAEQTARFGREAGDLGPVYGHQWRNFGATRLSDGSYARDGVDQLANVVAEIQRNPESRRLIVSGWHPGEADQVALPPCHTLFQFYVADGRLSCQLYQRSADVFLGVPFNIASYALLMIMMAQECDLTPGVFTHSIGDAHIYQNHIAGLKKQLEREPLPPPTVRVAKKPVDEVRFEDVELVDYQHHPFIKFPVAV